MAYGRKWRPSKTAKREFAQKMDEVRTFCDDNGITYSHSMDSFYFSIDGKEYRVSNHSVESSNAGAFDEMGNKVRELYHENGRENDVTYIHAGKTRIKEIYMDLKNGHELNGRGFRKEEQDAI